MAHLVEHQTTSLKVMSLIPGLDGCMFFVVKKYAVSLYFKYVIHFFGFDEYLFRKERIGPQL